MTYAGGPVSGGCFNPVVALAVAFRNFGTDLAPIFKPSTLLLYIAAQVAGALAVRSGVEIKFGTPHAIDAILSP